jgi:hypothetical protein
LTQANSAELSGVKKRRGGHGFSRVNVVGKPQWQEDKING